MKKIILIAIVVLISFEEVKAQAYARAVQGSKQSVFVELGGSAFLYSINYDTRFFNTPDGLGARGGIGYLAGGGAQLASVPILLNYLLGNNGHYFEMGVGPTILHARISDPSGFVGRRFDAAGTFVAGTLNLGYRYHPQAGGFQFRAGITPLIAAGFVFPVWPHISFGYAF